MTNSESQAAECFTYEDLRAGAHTVEGLIMKGIAGDYMTLVTVRQAKGFKLAMHAHPQEQMVCVISGKVRLTFGDQSSRDLGPGEFARIPPNVPHEANVLEDAISIEIFSPARNDLLI